MEKTFQSFHHLEGLLYIFEEQSINNKAEQDTHTIWSTLKITKHFSKSVFAFHPLCFKIPAALLVRIPHIRCSVHIKEMFKRKICSNVNHDVNLLFIYREAEILEKSKKAGVQDFLVKMGGKPNRVSCL